MEHGPVDDVFEKYLQELRNAYAQDGTEHSGRTALQNFLTAVAAGIAPEVHVQHEPKRQQDKGAPDFMISKAGMILGYVENKPIDTDLTKVLKSEQIRKYRELSSNLLVTDYLHFIWIRGDDIQRDSIAFSTDIADLKFTPREDRVRSAGKLLEGFFSTPPEEIGRAQNLAVELAKRSRLLRDFLGEELVRQRDQREGGRLFGLFQIFRDQVFHELTVREFADAFAQMLAYGLFLARRNADDETITLHNAREYVPGSFSLIRELIDFLTVLENEPYRDIRWVVEEILSIVNGLDLPAIDEDLSFRHRKVRRSVKARSEEEARLFERDPFVYFYEDYLSRYDPKLRESRGVYYTPPPVVNFIVRAIDDILKDPEVFNIRDGLADHTRVTVLDFACGTGTFLVEVFERIFETVGGADSGKASAVVREHMLKNIYGFEYLIAPYTIAHLKLSQYLKDKGHELSDGERLQVFLTNTLEPIEPQKNYLLPELTQEVEAAQKVKDQPILVITGNPPYSGHSRNMGPVARASIDAYKMVDGQPLGEKVSKWLHDDYVKFIRFAQLKMETIEEGIVGVITNHAWLDNPTFRGMRQSLMTSFDQIYVLDLHGNARRRERTPDGGDDQNVFDIEQGVAITLFIKKPNVEQKGVWHADLWEKRLNKYHAAMETSLRGIDWNIINQITQFYLFIPQDQIAWLGYVDGQSVYDIFIEGGTGIITKRDRLSIHYQEEDIWSVVREFVSLNPEEARRRF
jgi:hypothetical protein